MKVISYKKFANCEIFRDEHRAQWVHSQTPSQVEKVPSSQFQAKRLSFQGHSRLMIAPSKQYSKSRAWSNSKVHRKDSFRSSEDSSVCPIMSINVNRSGDPAINGYSFLWFINNPNISTPQLVIAARWASPSIGSILILPHPQIGFVLGSSVTSQAQKYLPAGSIVWYESVFSDERARERSRAREKGRMSHAIRLCKSGFHPLFKKHFEWGPKAFCVSMCSMARVEMWKFIVRSMCEWNVKIFIWDEKQPLMREKNAICAEKAFFECQKNPFLWKI